MHVICLLNNKGLSYGLLDGGLALLPGAAHGTRNVDEAVELVGSSPEIPTLF
jgi:hypothetical protein